MIPEFNQSGVLPPFINDPCNNSGRSPYKTTITEFVSRYANTNERREILKGLLEYRKKLRDINICEGFQWIDGSFVENIELIKDRPPADIDIVTFAFRPISNDIKWGELINNNQGLFTPNISKEKYHCDAYFVDLNINPIHVVKQASYWFGLFSHQRDSYLCKGMVEIPIKCHDDEALNILNDKSGIYNAQEAKN